MLVKISHRSGLRWNCTALRTRATVAAVVRAGLAVVAGGAAVVESGIMREMAGVLQVELNGVIAHGFTFLFTGAKPPAPHGDRTRRRGGGRGRERLNIEHRTSNIERPTSNAQHRTPNIEHRSEEGGLRISDG